MKFLKSAAALACVLGLHSMPVLAQDVHGRVLVLVDPDLAELAARDDPTPWEQTYALRSAEPGFATIEFDKGAGSVFHAGSGLIGDLGRDANRRKQIVPLLAATGGVDLVGDFVEGMSQAVSARGMQVERLPGKARASEAREKLASTGAGFAIVVEGSAWPMLSLSFDNRRVLVAAKFSLFEPGKPETTITTVFASEPVEAASALTLWSGNGATTFRTQLKAAGRQMAEALLARAGQPLPGHQPPDDTRAPAHLAPLDPGEGVAQWRDENGVLRLVPVLASAPSSARTGLFDAVAEPIADVSDASGPATLVMRGLNDSDAETGLRLFGLFAYDSADCKHASHVKLPIRSINPKRATSVDSAVAELPAGKEIWLNMTLMTASFAQNRNCPVTVGFTPQAGKHYRAEIAVDKPLSHCEGRVVELSPDGAPHATPYSTPELICGSKSQRNGERDQIRW